MMDLDTFAAFNALVEKMVAQAKAGSIISPSQYGVLVPNDPNDVSQGCYTVKASVEHIPGDKLHFKEWDA